MGESRHRHSSTSALHLLPTNSPAGLGRGDERLSRVDGEGRGESRVAPLLTSFRVAARVHVFVRREARGERRSAGVGELQRSPCCSSMHCTRAHESLWVPTSPQGVALQASHTCIYSPSHPELMPCPPSGRDDRVVFSAPSEICELVLDRGLKGGRALARDG
jgi:hypothetical protein